MGDGADWKWAGLRLLHEKWGVPFDLLAQVAELNLAFVERKASKDNWESFGSSVALHASLTRSFEEQLERLNDPQNGLDEEKRTRALSVMAKGLEPVVALASKLAERADTLNSGQSGGEHNKHQHAGHDSDAEQDANRTEELDRQLAALIEGLARERGLE